MPTIRCPDCAVRLRVTAEMAGRAARCPRCGAQLRLAAARPQPAAVRRAADAPLPFTVADLTALHRGDAVAIQPAPPVATSTAGAPTGAALDHAPVAPAAPPAGARHEFGRALWRELRLGTRGPNLVNYGLVVLGVALAHALLAIGSRFTLLGALVLFGWYQAYQFACVASGAAGEQDPPDLALSGGWWDDILAPIGRMIATLVVARLPALVFLLSLTLQTGAGLDLSHFARLLIGDFRFVLALLEPQHALMCGVLLAVGALFWPMLLLVVALGGTTALSRVDLMALTIMRTLPGYALVVAVVYGRDGLGWVFDHLWAHTGGGVPAALLGIAVEVYITIVAMRGIGLYYHHWKDRFAWDWG